MITYEEAKKIAQKHETKDKKIIEACEFYDSYGFIVDKPNEVSTSAYICVNKVTGKESYFKPFDSFTKFRSRKPIAI